MALRITIFSIFLITLSNNSDAVSRVDPLVLTDQGLIQGLKASDGEYSMFMGIPYARVDPSNPFGASTPQEPFDGVFEAHDDSALCPQKEEFNQTLIGSPDCLHLNVYVPTTAASKNKLPVLVWIYGGGFGIGFSGRYVYGPKYLVRHDIILVTLNYRLGPYGFMCLDIPEVPGNQGLKDQLLALRWIKNNIAAFGGDPSKITIFGESAGGMSVDFHIISPQEKLFDQAIMQSGSTEIPLLGEPHKDAPQRLAAHLGFNTDSVYDAISFLSSVDTSLVLAASIDLGLSFLPCVEKEFDDVESFVNQNWIAQTSIPKVVRMPIIIGYNNKERFSAYYNKPQSFFEGSNIFNDILSSYFDDNHPEYYDIMNVIQHFYIGDDEVSEWKIPEISDFHSDFEFLHPTYRTISKYIKNNAGNIFHYVFSYSGDRNFVKRRSNITVEGAVHADEISYLFDVEFFDETPTPADQKVIDQLTTLWANFVKYGNPTPEPSDLLPVAWTPITKNSLYYALNIDTDVSLGTRPFQSRMAFWDLIYKVSEDFQRSP